MKTMPFAPLILQSLLQTSTIRFFRRPQIHTCVIMVQVRNTNFMNTQMLLVRSASHNVLLTALGDRMLEGDIHFQNAKAGGISSLMINSLFFMKVATFSRKKSDFGQEGESQGTRIHVFLFLFFFFGFMCDLFPCTHFIFPIFSPFKLLCTRQPLLPDLHASL